jgi:hypothetical protein
MPDEVALLRRGKPVAIQRRLDLSFTTPCCSAFVPHGAIPARIGAIFDVHASLDLRLQPALH